MMFGIIMMTTDTLRILPVKFFFTGAEEMRITFKELTGYRFDHRHIRLSNCYGDEFILMMSRGKFSDMISPPEHFQVIHGFSSPRSAYFGIDLWDYKGQVKIYGESFKGRQEDTIPVKVMDGVEYATRFYSRKKVACSDCMDLLMFEDIYGKYFAAVFCQGCWEGTKGKYKAKGGWREVEAKETYD
jgi:hypothetical protein